MRLRIDWKATILATCVLLLLSVLVNLAFAALSFPVMVLPLALIAGGVLLSMTNTPHRRKRMRSLLQDQRRLAKSFVRCLLDRD